MTTQAPTVGRIVHYQSYGTPNGEYLPEPRAAIVTALPHDPLVNEHGTWIPSVSLCILNPTGMFFAERVPYSHEPLPGHWSWPPLRFEVAPNLAYYPQDKAS